MRSNALLLTWDRPLPGREQLGVELFQYTQQYLGGLKSEGSIESFDALFLEPRGPGVSGMIVVRGEPQKLATLTTQDEWIRYMLRAQMCLQNASLNRAITGAEIPERMKIWTELIPR